MIKKNRNNRAQIEDNREDLKGEDEFCRKSEKCEMVTIKEKIK